MSISTAELGAKSALGPKREGPLVWLARMLGPDHRLGYLFILPTVVLVLALVAYPFCYAIYLSLTRKYVGVPPVFVGFDNYVKLTFDGFFQRAVINSFIFTFGSVAVKLVLGMVMALVLTGMSALYANSPWAPVVIQQLGSPKVAALIHRVAASVFLTIFVIQLIYFIGRIGKNWKTFEWFGSHSLVPRWQDLWDMVAMFKWFFGKGPRPVFDRWTYWEKFDYWAVFWGVAIIGGSGLMLSFPSATASVLPGWVFNVGTLVHGEEAILAAVFLFTVHFFNNHFRPDKFPLDIVMFTGAVSLEEFQREHTVEYDRLVKTGELKRYLVDAPSRPMTLGSKILGFTLITIGLILLVLVVVGFFGSNLA